MSYCKYVDMFGMLSETETRISHGTYVEYFRSKDVESIFEVKRTIKNHAHRAIVLRSPMR